MDELKRVKIQLRRQLKAQREDWNPQHVAAASGRILQRLTGYQPLLDAQHVFCYVSCGNEVQTHDLIQWMLQQQKRVSLPRLTPPRQMQAHTISSLSQLQPGAYGIPAPPAGQLVESTPQVCITPGLAFTKGGARIGLGAGYYDRYLQEHTDALVLALCFSWQLKDHLPLEPHDQLMDVIVTEKETIRCTQHR